MTYWGHRGRNCKLRGRIQNFHLLRTQDVFSYQKRALVEFAKGGLIHCASALTVLPSVQKKQRELFLTLEQELNYIYVINHNRTSAPSMKSVTCAGAAVNREEGSREEERGEREEGTLGQ